MAIRNNSWINLCSTRAWPLDDKATGTGDGGERLPNDLLADLNLRFPESLGHVAFLGGITVTSRLVSAVFMGAPDGDTTSGLTALAAVSVAQPVTVGRHYAVTALADGVGGFAAFGDGIADGEDFTARFSTPQQSLILQRCARWVRNLPITSLGRKFSSKGLTGMIKIQAGTDLEIVYEELLIGDRLRDALVFRLLQKTTGRNPFQIYAGPCGKRPESRTCDVTPIEALNTVQPDCDGNINIEFRGLNVAHLGECGPGLVLDHPLGLAEACDPRVAAQTAGYTDLCTTSSASL